VNLRLMVHLRLRLRVRRGGGSARPPWWRTCALAVIMHLRVRRGGGPASSRWSLFHENL